MINREKLLIPASSLEYVNLVKEKDPLKGITRNTKKFRKLLNDIPKKKVDYAYAPGKWTLKEMLQHIIDAERVFAFRALHMARKDAAPLPGFDENAWAANSQAKKRKWKDLIDEFFLLRYANEILFSSLDDKQLLLTGTANNSQISVATLAFSIAGHLNHHINIIKARYLQPYPGKNGKSVNTAEKKKEAGKKTTKKKSDNKKKVTPKKKVAATKKSKPQERGAK